MNPRSKSASISLETMLRSQGEVLASVQVSRARMSSMMSGDNVFASPKKKKQKQGALAAGAKQRLALSPIRVGAKQEAAANRPDDAKAVQSKDAKKNSGSKRKKVRQYVNFQQ